MEDNEWILNGSSAIARKKSMAASGVIVEGKQFVSVQEKDQIYQTIHKRIWLDKDTYLVWTSYKERF